MIHFLSFFFLFPLKTSTTVTLPFSAEARCIAAKAVGGDLIETPVRVGPAKLLCSACDGYGGVAVCFVAALVAWGALFTFHFSVLFLSRNIDRGCICGGGGGSGSGGLFVFLFCVWVLFGIVLFSVRLCFFSCIDFCFILPLFICLVAVAAAATAVTAAAACH